MGKYDDNPKIKLGKAKLLDESYSDPKELKMRVTTWIDSDIYEELNRRADAGDGKGRYQTLMNEVLRRGLFENKPEEVALWKAFYKSMQHAMKLVEQPSGKTFRVGEPFDMVERDAPEGDEPVVQRKYPDAAIPHASQGKGSSVRYGNSPPAISRTEKPLKRK